MTFKKWQKPPKKGEKLTVAEVKEPVIEEENAVSTVVENEISNNELPVWTTFQGEEETFLKKQPKDKVLGSIWGATVTKPKWRIAFEAQVAPVPMFKIPADIRQYLINKWFTTEVYKKDKQWLEEHGADMEMIEKLKQFLTTL